MKIAVTGSSLNGDDSEILRKAFEIGKEIALNNCTLMNGGCLGYPYAAAKGAFQNNGKVIGVSPAKNEEQHINRYNFPTDCFTEIRFTGLGIPERNLPLVKSSDGIIIISGKIGTLNEFTIAFHEGKKIGVLNNSGGITDLIPDIARVCNKRNEVDNIVYSGEPKELVDKLIEKLKL
jgi:hypothetical protein